ncbi:THAP domain-containing protein 1 A-like isoform X2 [Cebidichthys violaceus]|uniref:THAP domain-containing protein 1 A-like isoform X2 n=1 Tax=Cebidichthys violaceus TaxID=271503 RepID=UPI0035C97BDC
MPTWCIVPGCSSYKKKREELVSVNYHRLPTDVERCKQWLRAVKNPKYDENAPTSALGSLRVCSLHFAADDYNRDMRSELMGGPIKKLLKTSAVPAVFTSDAGRGEAEPREERGRTDTEEHTACTSTVSASSYETETRPVTSAASAHGHGGLVPELHDTWAVIDRPPGQVTSTGIQVNVPEMCTATVENRPTVQHIVDEEAILQLMKNCPMCDRKCRCTKRTCGPYFIVYQSCYFCNYQRKWANQPEARNMNIQKANTPPKKKLRPKNKVSVKAAKTQLSQLSKASTPDSSVSEPHCLLET